VNEMTGNVILLGVCVLLLAYLVAALLWPEKF
jgi:K+-transporting ATPase KdpF subunit